MSEVSWMPHDLKWSFSNKFLWIISRPQLRITEQRLPTQQATSSNVEGNTDDHESHTQPRENSEIEMPSQQEILEHNPKEREGQPLQNDHSVGKTAKLSPKLRPTVNLHEEYGYEWPSSYRRNSQSAQQQFPSTVAVTG